MCPNCAERDTCPYRHICDGIGLYDEQAALFTGPEAFAIQQSRDCRLHLMENPNAFEVASSG